MKGFKAFNSDLKCLEFQYKENETHVFIGDVVLCKSGFHFCTELQDVVKYYCNPTMRVFEIEASGTITEPETDCSKRACSELKLIRELSLEEVKNSITNSRLAFYWARYIGDREHMKQYVTESKLAYHWAFYIGDQEYMKQYVTEPEWAYNWAMYIGDREHMKQYVTEPEWAFYWAKNIGDQEHMKQYVTEPEWAFYWVRYIDSSDKKYFLNRNLI